MSKKFLTILFYLIPFFSFSQTIYPVCKDGKWGGTSGTEVIIPIEYQFITPLSNGTYFRVGQNNKIGVINTTGKIILPIAYDRVEFIKDDTFVGWNNTDCFLIDNNNTHLSKPYSNLAPFANLIKSYSGDQLGIIDINGKELITPKFDDITLTETSIFITSKGNFKGFLNSNCEEQVTPNYQKIDIIESNLLIATIKGSPALDYIVIDSVGTITSKKTFNSLKDFKRFQIQNILKYQCLEVKKGNYKTPQWVDVLNDYYLVAPTGKVLLNGLSFFYIKENNSKNIVIGRREEKDGTLNYYLIDQQKGTILFKDHFKDIVLEDFSHSNWARISIDTLWDNLININGAIKRQITDEANQYSIETIGNFYDNVAYFKSKDGFYGFIDENAEIITAPIYTLASDFNNGYAIVKKFDKFGLVYTDGTIQIPIEYDGIGYNKGGWLKIKEGEGSIGKWGIIDITGKEIIPTIYDEIQIDATGANIKSKGRWGRYSKTNKWSFTPKLNVNILEPFENGIAKIKRKQIIDPIDRKTITGYKYVGYIKEDGTVLIPPVYTDIIGFERAWKDKEGLALIEKRSSSGFVNYNGEIALTPEYIQSSGFPEVWTIHKGIAKARTIEGKQTFIDYNGKEVIQPEFDFIADNFQEIWMDSSGVAIAELDNKKGLIDYEGKRACPLIYDQLFAVNDKQFVAKKDNKWGLINYKGDTLISFKYNNSAPIHQTQYIKFIKDSTVVYSINKDGQWSVKNTTTPLNSNRIEKMNTTEFKNYKFHFIGNNYAIVSKKGDSKLQGVINEKGKVIVKLNFKKIKPFENGLAVAQKNGKTAKDRKYGFIDKSGKWVIAPTYNIAKSFSNEIAPVCIKNKWGYINQKGELIIPIQFNSATSFKGDYATVNTSSIINTKGEILGKLSAGEELFMSDTSGCIIKGIGYMQHTSHSGVALYSKKFDEVTPFNSAGIAFVKTGEVWELTRKINDSSIKKRFSRLQMEIYLEKYGAHRKVVSLTGDVAKDLEFEKVINGTWRMIGKDGQPLNTVNFTRVSHNQEVFNVTISNLEHIINEKNSIVNDNYFLGTLKAANDKVILFESGNTLLVD
ncbi:WG repeat-containing protein [Flammeovirga pectinis]|uniref:WG repeat-containing protein n=1 Tax=Flammeovirga pectinis TaxID=2494373 RepID=A0A3Q9FLR7_9BACT|nr:WG repeat-containing protein [Flammeovirga pectinis]AZQ61096.1 WG repeat-containing protein [Flammeovirga pectinis]